MSSIRGYKSSVSSLPGDSNGSRAISSGNNSVASSYVNSSSNIKYSTRQPRGEPIEEEEEVASDYNSEQDNQIYNNPRLVTTHDGNLDESLLSRTEGWIYKKGGVVNSRGGRRNWKRRYFKLEPIDYDGQTAFELCYYDDKGGNLKGTISLFDVEIYCESKSLHSKVKFEFQILLQNGGILQLSCDDEIEREEWMETLNMVITYIRKLSSSNSVALNGYDPLFEDDQDVYDIGEEIGLQSRAYGPGIFGTEAGQISNFTIQINDVTGQMVTVGGMPITVTISNTDLLYYVRVNDNDDGSYSCQYTVVTPGLYELAVKINDEHHIAGSPFQIQVFPAKTIPSFCVAEGACLSVVQPTGMYSFQIIAKDTFNNRKVTGGDPFEISIVGPGHLHSLSDDSNGSYTCTFELKSPENTNQFTSKAIRISVTLHGKHIYGSPFTPTIVATAPKVISSVLPPPKIETGASAIVSSAKQDEPNPNPGVGSILAQLQQSRQQLASSNPIVLDNSNNTTNTTTNNNSKPNVKSSEVAKKPTNTLADVKPNPNPNPKSVPNLSSNVPLQQTSASSTKPSPQLEQEASAAASNPNISKLERARQKALMIKSLQSGGSQGPSQILSTSDLIASGNNSINTTSIPTAPQSSSQAVPVGATRRQSITGLNKVAKKVLSSEDSLRYLSETKRGFIGNLPMTASIDDHNIWKASHDSLVGVEEVGNIILRNINNFRYLFEAFFEIIDGAEMVRLNNPQGTGFYRLLDEFKITPDVVTKAEAKNLFSLVLTCQRTVGSPCVTAGGGVGIDFTHFIKLLVMLAIFAFSKTGNASKPRYNNPEVKVDSLFSKWGLGDQLKLQVIKTHIKTQAKDKA